MKTNQTKIRPAPAHRRHRESPTAFRKAPAIPGNAAAAPEGPKPAPRLTAEPQPDTAHDFLALCLYPGMGDHSTAA